MKLVLFTRNGSDVPRAGVLGDSGVVPLEGFTGQAALLDVIDHFERVHVGNDAISLDQVHLLAPIPRPGKILCSTASYGANAAERAPLLLTLKSAESVIGPGQTVILPAAGDEWQFVPEAELGLVIRGPARRVKAADWASAVFGYTCVIDVMAQGDAQFGRDFWLAKADTLGPLGACIVTVDEVPDPSLLRVTSRVNGQPAQDYAVRDADYTIGEQIELATTIMTLNTGDILACGTSRNGLRPLSAGDNVEVDITGVGRLQVMVGAGVHA